MTNILQTINEWSPVIFMVMIGFLLFLCKKRIDVVENELSTLECRLPSEDEIVLKKVILKRLLGADDKTFGSKERATDSGRPIKMAMYHRMVVDLNKFFDDAEASTNPLAAEIVETLYRVISVEFERMLGEATVKKMNYTFMSEPNHSFRNMRFIVGDDS